MHIQDEQHLVNILNKNIDINSKILDVGCGIGNNIKILKGYGYKNVQGVDISQEMVTETIEKGFEAFTVEEFFSSSHGNYDVLLFSHVLEHLPYPDIVNMLESYFSRAKVNAKVIIVMPILYDAFFNDVDHVKPYYPDGLMTLFSDKVISKQYKSNYHLKLLDIEFRKKELMPYNIKSRYIKSIGNKILFKSFLIIMRILKFISFNIISKTTGYIGIFKLTKNK